MPVTATIPHRALAERYAKALFDLADARGEVDSIASDFLTLQTALDGSTELRRLLASPLVTRAAKQRVMTALLDKIGASASTQHFVGLVTRKARLFALPSIIRVFQEALAQRRGEIRAEVRVAQALSDSQAQALRERLSSAYGDRLDIDTQVDPELLGGLTLRVGSKLVDASLKTQLSRLEQAMRRSLLS